MRSKGKRIWKQYQGKKLTTLIDFLMLRLWNKASETMRDIVSGYSQEKDDVGSTLEEAIKTLRRENICERISAKRIKYQHRQLQCQFK